MSRIPIALASALCLACELAPASRLHAQPPGRTATALQAPHLVPADCPFPRSDWPQDVTLTCSQLALPEVRGRATSPSVILKVAVLHAREPNGQPPVVMVHGGPGESGVRIFTRVMASSPLLQHRDIVIYDQRGSGLSEPVLCPEYAAVEDSANTRHVRAEQERIWNDGARRCIASLKARGIDPSAYNTATSALDLIDLRRALGVRSWDLMAGSYGVRLVLETMRRDSAAVRSVVLEYPVTWSPDFQTDAALSFQRTLERLFAQCAAQPACNTAFPHVEQNFYALYDSLTHSPFPIPREFPDGRVDTVMFDGTRLMNIIRGSVTPRYGRLSGLPFLLNELLRGDRLRAARTLSGYFAEGPATAQQVIVHLVNCFDVYGPRYLARFDSINAVARPPFRRRPMDDCPLWVEQRGDSTAWVQVRSAIPALILTGFFDDRTPTEYGRRVAQTLEHAYLVEFPDETHGGRPTGPTPCHVSIQLQFLTDPSHTPDTSCIASIPAIQFATDWSGVRGAR